MPKGRINAPATASDGIWFEHRGLPDPGTVLRNTHTSTGLMLNSPYKSESSWYPPNPPKVYSDKNSPNFKNSNSFSVHDNRHSFQDHGVYFGNGHDSRTLGKNLLSSDKRQHSTTNEFLKHTGREATSYSYHTNYFSSYEGKPTDSPPKSRRFPKIYKEGNPGLTKLDSTTTDWFQEPDVPHKTPTQVLATAQEPFLPKNMWKYSYHGKSKCYPPYDKVNPNKPFSTWQVCGVPSKKGEGVLT